MEYYGKIACISYVDLIREPDPIMSESNYKQLSRRGKINVVRPGKGLGSYALVEIATMPQRFQDKIKDSVKCYLMQFTCPSFEAFDDVN